MFSVKMHLGLDFMNVENIQRKLVETSILNKSPLDQKFTLMCFSCQVFFWVCMRIFMHFSRCIICITLNIHKILIISFKMQLIEHNIEFEMIILSLLVNFGQS